MNTRRYPGSRILMEPHLPSERNSSATGGYIAAASDHDSEGRFTRSPPGAIVCAREMYYQGNDGVIFHI